MALKDILHNLPEVRAPVEKKLAFNTKLKWTIIILASFFVLANIRLYGITEGALERFEYLAIILGTDFGSIISLGIGPIVMSSIILQLLVGSKILDIDTSSEEGKKFFQGLQKLLVFFFIVFEAIIYVLMGGISAIPGFTLIVIIQLIVGGLIIVLMDEVTTKWGFGSGVSLFIVAGVSWRLFTGLFQFVGAGGGNCLTNFTGNTAVPCAGKVLVFLQSVIAGNPTEAFSALAVLIATAAIFLIVVWAQSLKVEIPLSFDRLRGYGIRWPLAFFYASVIPVILTAALVANVQLFSGLNHGVVQSCVDNVASNSTFMEQLALQNQTLTTDIAVNSGMCGTGSRIAEKFLWLGTFSQGRAESGLAYWVSSTDLLSIAIRGDINYNMVLQGLIHIIFFMFFSTLFAVFWVKTSGMDASSQAKNLLSSGLQIPGFRKDERVLETQ
jgi:preprotein translocase subunit SecY